MIAVAWRPPRCRLVAPAWRPARCRLSVDCGAARRDGRRSRREIVAPGFNRGVGERTPVFRRVDDVSQEVAVAVRHGTDVPAQCHLGICRPLKRARKYWGRPESPRLKPGATISSRLRRQNVQTPVRRCAPRCRGCGRVRVRCRLRRTSGLAAPERTASNRPSAIDHRQSTIDD